MIRARLVSLGLVAAMGLLLVVSLVLSAVVAALHDMLALYLPFAGLLVEVANFVLSLALLSLVIGAIYKILPDCDIDWHDALAGAVVTAFLITLGKQAIGIYIGHSATLSSYGAAGSVLAALFWIYYSAQIFLLGAEFTRVYAERGEKFRHSPAESGLPSDRASAAPDRLSRPAG
jgi:membrane protein